MTEDQKGLCDEFSEAITRCVGACLNDGLHPMHMANLLLIASAKITAQIQGPGETAAGFRRAADEIEAGLLGLH
jgi:hypothetical protein